MGSLRAKCLWRKDSSDSASKEYVNVPSGFAIARKPCRCGVRPFSRENFEPHRRPLHQPTERLEKLITMKTARTAILPPVLFGGHLTVG
ncbi:hypothetical protein SLA2020_504110 [Shorea laevis]